MKRIIVAIFMILAMVLSACTQGAPTDAPDDTETTTASVTTDTEVKPDPPITKTLKIGSYNVKHFEQVNHDFSVIAGDILSKELEIVGLQEIDYKNNRSDKLDEPKEIAKALGWDYCEFAKTIDYQGGAYGHCIVSKHPIKSFVVKTLPGTGEKRSFGHAVIGVDGVQINFINTHLSHESRESRAVQFQTIASYVKKLDNFIIVGDFNTEDFTEFDVIENATLVNNSKFSLKTYPSNDPTTAIDNVVTSPMFTLGRPKVLMNQHSDHIMLFTEVTYIVKE